MVVVLIKNKVKEGCQEAYFEVAQRFAKEQSKYPGCLKAYALRSQDQRDIIVNLELWESKDAFEHYDGSVFMRFKPELKPLFIKNKTEIYEE